MIRNRADNVLLRRQVVRVVILLALALLLGSQPTGAARADPYEDVPAPPDSFAIWRVYHDDDYGFSIRYPVETWDVKVASEKVGAPTYVIGRRRTFISVTNTDDHGRGSLRQAIHDAIPGDTIVFSLPPSSTITLTTGELVITKEITIDGTAVPNLALSANGASRVIEITPGITVTINSLAVINGSASIGGGILNEGSLLNLNDTIVMSNTATGGSPSSKTASVESARGGGIYNTGTLQINDSTIAFNVATTIYGSGAGFGGGIFNMGLVTVNRSLIRNNRAGWIDAGSGGGLSNTYDFYVHKRATAVVNDSHVENNITMSGGGIDNSSSNLTVYNSIVRGNQARYGAGISTGYSLELKNSAIISNSALIYGGGLATSGVATVTNSTISGNSAYDSQAPSGHGGAIFNGGQLLLLNDTISNNRASRCGGVESVGQQVRVRLHNTLIGGNIALAEQSPDCEGTITSEGYNLIQDTANCTFIATTGDLIGIAPLLGSLQDNGGDTWTHALLPGSIAINAGDPIGCLDADGTILLTDQRGFPRASPVGGRCDIGAFEYSWWISLLPFVQR